ncbi:MAG: hypothetical protein ACLGI6_17115, partial [Gammaproteobacteria bacterium]
MTTRPRFTTVPIGLLTAAILTACGGGGDSASTPPAPVPPPTQPGPAPDPVPSGPAAISTQPQAATVAAGASASFTVGVTGSGASIQWLRNGAPIVGATAPTYTIAAVQPGDDGSFYRAVVRSGTSELKSAAVPLRIAGTTARADAGAVDFKALARRTYSEYFPALTSVPNGPSYVFVRGPQPGIFRVDGNKLTRFGDYAGCQGSADFDRVDLTADGAGNLYQICYRYVVKIAANGRASILAGSDARDGGISSDGVDHPGRFDALRAIAAHTDGTVYVADKGGTVIRKIAPDGALSTLGPAAHWVSALAVSPRGELYAATPSAIERVGNDGSQTPVAGQPYQYGQADGPGLSARLAGPRGLAFDAQGTLWFADDYPMSVRQFDPNTGIVKTVATGTSVPGNEVLSAPMLVAPERDNSVLVVDGASTLLRVTAAGAVTTLFERAGTPTAGFVDGAAAQARFNHPGDLAADIAGNLYVADLGNRAVRKISPSGIVTTLARDLQPLGDWSRNGSMKLSPTQDGGVFVMGAKPVRVDADGTVTPLVAPQFDDWGGKSAFMEIVVDPAGNQYQVIQEVKHSESCPSSGCPIL